MRNIIVKKYSKSHKDEVIKLILNIQQDEFNVAINLHDQPDLENIEEFYQSRNGNFWIAQVGEMMAGTIGLLDIGNHCGALRKMFVKEEFRGREFGIAQLLLDTLLQWAKDKGMRKIMLGTTEKFLAAQRFYEKNHFSEIDKSLLPKEFPIMRVDVKFYEYLLSE